MNKKLLILICLITLSFGFNLYADDTLVFDTSNYKIELISFEDTILDGNIEVSLVFKFHDTTEYCPNISFVIQGGIQTPNLLIRSQAICFTIYKSSIDAPSEICTFPKAKSEVTDQL